MKQHKDQTRCIMMTKRSPARCLSIWQLLVCHYSTQIMQHIFQKLPRTACSLALIATFTS